MKKVLITGIAGFVGSHLAEFLLKKRNVKVYGIEKPRREKDNIKNILKKIELYTCDIIDIKSVRKVIAQIKPDYIFHLAAQTFVPASWQLPQETLTTNILGELNIFEAVRNLGLKCKIQIAGSSEEYGLVYKNELPIKETNPLRPLSPYAVSKVAQDLLGYQYFKSYGLNIIRTRAFNHTGPRRGNMFVSSSLAKQIALIEKGKQEPVIYVGNLEAIRDFMDVRDLVEAYWLALQKCLPGEVYNISSGKGRAIREVLDILLSFSKKNIKVKLDPQRLRPSDVPILIGDSTKFRKLTNWKPKIKFKDTLKDLLNYWREKINPQGIDHPDTFNPKG